MGNLYTEKHTTMLEEIKQVPVNGKASYAHALKDIIQLSCNWPKAIYWLNAIHIKIPMIFVAEIKNSSQNSYGIVRNPEEPKKKIMKKNNKPGGFTLPEFKIYYKTTIIKAVGTDIKIDKLTNGIK